MMQKSFSFALFFLASFYITFAQGNRATNYPAPIEGDHIVRDFKFESGASLTEAVLRGAKDAGFDHCLDKMQAFEQIEKLLPANTPSVSNVR